MKKIFWLITVIFSLTEFNCYANFLPSHVIYVKQAQTQNTQNGKTWATAYQTLTAGLKSANPGDNIWVASGTYIPTTTDNKNVSFELKSGVGVYGGFKGDEAFFWQRNPKKIKQF